MYRYSTAAESRPQSSDILTKGITGKPVNFGKTDPMVKSQKHQVSKAETSVSGHDQSVSPVREHTPPFQTPIPHPSKTPNQTPTQPHTSTYSPALREAANRWRARQDQKVHDEVQAWRLKSLSYIQPWSKIAPADKYVVAGDFLDGVPCLTFSLNFAPDLERRLLRSTDPKDMMRRRLMAAFSDEGIHHPVLAFVLEINQERRLHLHGIIAATGFDSAKLSPALRKAGGVMTGRPLATQERVTEAWSPSGWCNYMNKHKAHTAAYLRGCEVTFYSRSMTKAVKDHHALVGWHRVSPRVKQSLRQRVK